MVCKELQWRVNEKYVFNIDTGKMEKLRFLRMNTIHDYNMTMGSVDLADKLQGTYRIDNVVRNRKWWWSILFWSVGVMLTNAYIMYIKINVSDGVEK